MKFNKNKLAIALFFVSAYISFNILEALMFNVLGIAFLISGLYGIVLSFRKGKFIFK